MTLICYNEPKYKSLAFLVSHGTDNRHLFFYFQKGKQTEEKERKFYRVEYRVLQSYTWHLGILSQSKKD
jgi:hypothetical protein